MAVADVDAPVPAPGLALVYPTYAGLCGTDLHIYQGEHPRAQPGLVIGHEIVGHTALPPGAGDATGAEDRAGTAVFVNPLISCGTCETCLRGHSHVCDKLRLFGIDANGGAAEVLAVPPAHLVPLPATLDLRLAAMIEPLAVAVRAVRRGGVGTGDRVHVVGAGPIGLLVATCARLNGTSVVTVSEMAARRGEMAASLGFRVVGSEARNRSAEVVFDCTGHPSASPTVLEWAATGGTIVTVGAYPGVVGVNLQDMMFRELRMVGTRVYSPEDVSAAIALISAGSVDFSLFITSVVPLDQGPEAITRLRSGEELKVLLEI